jgi:hypothetical protein
MFSFEDLMTDSTSALKDTRYPTVTMRRQHTNADSLVNEVQVPILFFFSFLF